MSVTMPTMPYDLATSIHRMLFDREEERAVGARKLVNALASLSRFDNAQVVLVIRAPHGLVIPNLKIGLADNAVIRPAINKLADLRNELVATIRVLKE